MKIDDSSSADPPKAISISFHSGKMSGLQCSAVKSDLVSCPDPS